MKTSFFCITGLFMLLVMFACNNNKSIQQDTGKDNTELKGQNHTEIEEHGGPGSVQLNNGAKWKANPETTAGISSMKKLVADFTSTPTSHDYKMLQENLEAEFKMIFRKCTMTGEAHNQLHNYLLPLKEMIDTLDEPSVDKSARALLQIQNKLAEYDQFFV